MATPKRFWAPQGSVDEALLDSAIACVSFVIAMYLRDQWLLWAFAAFWGTLAVRGWHTYLYKDKQEP